MCVVCVAGEVDSVRAEYGTRDTHGEAFTLLHERTFTSPGPWPLSTEAPGWQITLFAHARTHGTHARTREERSPVGAAGGQVHAHA